MRAEPTSGRPRVLIAAALGLLLLVGCDAGHPDRPGEDNLRGRPRLRIVQPRPDQVIPLRAERPERGRVRTLFDLLGADLARPGRPGYALYTAIDDRPPTRVRDLGRALLRKPPPGAHVVVAWLLDSEGEVVHAPGSYAAHRFFVGSHDRAAMRSPEPILIWASPRGSCQANGEGIRLDVLVSGRVLGEETCRLRFTTSLGQTDVWTSGPARLPTLPPGRHAVRVELLEPQRRVAQREGRSWRRVEGAWTALERIVEVVR
jgi:hypothetical protein